MAKQFRIHDPGGWTDGRRPMDARGNAIYTPQEVERINEAGNRRRINGHEMEAMMGLIAAGNLIITCTQALESHAQHVGALSTMRRLRTQLRNLIVRLNMGVETRQMGAIANQMTDAVITLSSVPVSAMVNIKLDDLLHICNRAMEYCGFCCTCTRDQSKDCTLRRALDCVPGAAKAAKEIARADATKCPYSGMEMEVDA